MALVYLSFLAFLLSPGASADLPLPYGTAAGDYAAPPNDDGSNRVLPLDPPMNFFGQHLDRFYQNTNGYISFYYDPYEGFSVISPFPFTSSRPVIACYWADMHTEDEGNLYARAVSNDSDLDVANGIVARAAGNSDFTGTSAAVATWDGVLSWDDNGRNTFQTILIWSGDVTWVIFAYKQIEYFAAYGRTLVGVNSGDGIEGAVFADIASNEDITALLTGTNCDTPGTYAYRIQNAFSLAPTATPAPTGTPVQLPLPYGLPAGDWLMLSENDELNDAIPLSQPMKFYNYVFDKAYQNDNGHITFLAPSDHGIGYPIRNDRDPPVVASYWCDSDPSKGGEMYARAVSSESDLALASDIVARATGNNTFSGTAGFVATWVDVPPFQSAVPTKFKGGTKNTFQTTLIYNSDETWVIFAFDRLEYYQDWTYNDQIASLVGFNAGDGINGKTVAAVQSEDDMEELLTETNCGIPGVFVHQVESRASSTLPLLYGPGTGDVSTRPRDGSSVAIPLLQPMQFYSTEFNQAYQNTRGIITFLNPFSAAYGFDGFPSEEYPALVASYWTAVDTEDEGEMYARAVATESDLALANDIVARTTGNSNFNGTAAFVATWLRSELSRNDQRGREITRRNSFQTILIYNNVETWAIFAYQRLEYFGLEELGVDTAFAGLNAGVGSEGKVLAEITSDEEMEELLEGYEYALRVGTRPATLPLPYGPGTGDVSTPPNDDGSSVAIPLSQPMKFYNTEYNQAYQNTNGIITFLGPLEDQYGYDGFPSDEYPALVASYWTDVDSQYGGGEMYARTVTAASDLVLANDIVARAIRAGGNETSSFNGTAAFVATWVDVPQYLEGDGKVNTFQTILVYNDMETWVIFAYETLEYWGLVYFGLDVVFAGLNAGVGNAGEVLTGITSDEDMEELSTGTNCDIPGVYALQVGNALTSSPSIPPSPAPSTPVPTQGDGCTRMFLQRGVHCINFCLEGDIVNVLLGLNFQGGECPQA